MEKTCSACSQVFRPAFVFQIAVTPGGQKSHFCSLECRREALGAESFRAKRARRIAIPWLFWCLVYRVIFEIVSDDPFVVLTDPMTLFIGPSIHLWFLPFVMLTLPLIPILSLSIVTQRDLVLAGCILVAVSLPLGWLHAQVGLAGWFVDVGLYRQPLPQ